MNVFALATSREVLEVEVPDILALDIMPSTTEDSAPDTFSTLKRM